MQILIYYIASFLECFMVFAIGLSLIGIRLPLKKIFVMGLTLLSISLLIRQLYFINNIALGTHSFIIFIFKVVIIVIIGKQSILEGMIASLLSYLLLIICETVMICNMYYALSIKPVYIKDTYLMSNITGIIVDIILLAIFYITYIKGFTIINISKEAG